MRTKKVMVGMSGGVDSSVTALLLKKHGYEVAGATFHLWDKLSQADAEDARAVCESLGIRHYVFDLRSEFKEYVVEPFVAGYEKGETPNPCIFCNKNIKFGTFWKKAAAMDYDYIATGHYASVVYDDERGMFRVKKSIHDRKDQSYVLYCIERDILDHILMPLGVYNKSAVRKMAEEYGLPVHHKAESQDICFIEDDDYVGFLREYTGKKPPGGDFLDLQGNIIGKHKGVTNYTIGQRRGIGISFSTPVYVSGIDGARNTVTLAGNDELFKTGLRACALNWHDELKTGITMRFNAKIRYAHREQPCAVTLLPDGTAEVIFDSPQRAVTPGQSVVFYSGLYVAGGGIIISAF